MSKQFTLLGHPMHPPFVHFPLGLLSISLLWDTLALILGEELWWQLGFWCIAAGLAATLPASITGLIEFSRLPDNRSKVLQTAVRHMMWMLVAASAYGTSLMLRGRDAVPAEEYLLPALATGVFGFICLQIGGWLGGELVYRHRIGVEDTGQKDSDSG